jgi:hypothetical protein
LLQHGFGGDFATNFRHVELGGNIGICRDVAGTGMFVVEPSKIEARIAARRRYASSKDAAVGAVGQGEDKS